MDDADAGTGSMTGHGTGDVGTSGDAETDDEGGGSDGAGTETDGDTDDSGTVTVTATVTETGTSGPDCSPDPSDGECVACLKHNCCDGFVNCLANEDCACVVKCLDGGATDTATDTGTYTAVLHCPDLCNGGGNPWGGFSYCVGGFCVDQCPGA